VASTHELFSLLIAVRTRADAQEFFGAPRFSGDLAPRERVSQLFSTCLNCSLSVSIVLYVSRLFFEIFPVGLKTFSRTRNFGMTECTTTMKTTNPPFDDTLSHIVYDVLCMPHGGMF